MEVQVDNNTESNNAAQVAATTTEEQVSTSQQTDGQQATEEQELSWTEDQKAYIKSLRDENAKYRTRAKELDSKVSETSERLSKFETGLKTLFGDEGEELSPEQKIETLQARNEALEVQSALKEAAFEYGVSRETYDYFEFLVGKKLNSLEDGEEISNEDLEEFAKEANGRQASSNTSVDDSQSPAPANGAAGTTLEEFMAMGIGEKSVLYQKDQALYNSLSQQARAATKKR